MNSLKLFFNVRCVSKIFRKQCVGKQVSLRNGQLQVGGGCSKNGPGSVINGALTSGQGHQVSVSNPHLMGKVGRGFVPTLHRGPQLVYQGGARYATFNFFLFGLGHFTSPFLLPGG
jgi:hypothetical protein